MEQESGLGDSVKKIYLKRSTPMLRFFTFLGIKKAAAQEVQPGSYSGFLMSF